MAKLILHIGPGKCGSSSIQQFFTTHSKPCVENTRYILLNPLEINELNCEEPNEPTLRSFTEQLSENLVRHHVLILSHEYLYSTPFAIRNICRLAQNLAEQISIIGYSRRQSDFLVSAYSQWFFRSRKKTNEATNVLARLGLDAVFFTGLERQIIAFIVNDFFPVYDLDWRSSYDYILELAHDTGAVVKCGVLPSKESDVPLIQDFCEKSGLNLRHKIENAVRKIANPSFDQYIVEALNNAVALGLEVPGPHAHNEVIDLLSSKITKSTKKPSDFLANLKSYIDSYYLESNKQFCKKYSLNETYFAVYKRFSKPDILDLIIQEGQKRTSNQSHIINDYRILSAKIIELCIKLAKGD